MSALFIFDLLLHLYLWLSFESSRFRYIWIILGLEWVRRCCHGGKNIGSFFSFPLPITNRKLCHLISWCCLHGISYVEKLHSHFVIKYFFNIDFYDKYCTWDLLFRLQILGLLGVYQMLMFTTLEQWELMGKIHFSVFFLQSCGAAMTFSYGAV